MSTTDGDAFTAGAADAARLAKDVQDLGFATARSIVERFVDLFAQFAGAGPGGGSAAGGSAAAGRDADAKSAPFWLGGSDGSMRKLQADMVQATDSYLSLMGQFSEASLRLFDATRWWQPSSEAHDDLLHLPQVAPGGRASARVWLHNTTASVASGLRPWCPGLATHAGAALPAAAVTCQPERIHRLEPGASSEVLVTVAVPDDATPGTYHGQLLVEGLPDVVFPLRVRVQPATDR